METEDSDKSTHVEDTNGKQENANIVDEEMEEQEETEVPESSEKIPDVAEVENEQMEEDDDISLASSDLSVADEACANSEEAEEVEELEEVEEGDYDPVEEFDADSFVPTPTKHIRPPWLKSTSTDCDSKNWEIFVEALEAFNHGTIFEGLEDFVVTVETLLPHLPSCFVALKKDNTVTETEAAMKILGWLTVCLGKEVQGFEEAKKMQDIAFAILKSVADTPKGSSVGKLLVESGVVELLVGVLEESECADFRLLALCAIFRLISSPMLWRVTNAQLCEIVSDDSCINLYSRIVSLSLGKHYFVSKYFLQMITLLVSWLRFINSLLELERGAKDLVAAVYDATDFQSLPIMTFSEKWTKFLISFNAVRESITEFDDEKVCAAFDVYALLQTSDLLSICVRLLSMSRVVDRWPNVLQFIQLLLNDRYYGTLFITHDVHLVQLYTELKQLEEIEKAADENCEQSDCFDEGVCELDEKYPKAAELRLTLAYRLRVLHLLDKIRGCSSSMRHNIDDEERVSALTSLCELCNDPRGRREVVWTLSQKYVYYLFDIFECCNVHKEFRSSISFAFSLHLLAIVVADVDEPRFWLRNVKSFSRLVTKGGLTYSTHRKLFDYLSPCLDSTLSNMNNGGSEITNSLMKRMSSMMDRRVEVSPGICTAIRLVEAVVLNSNYTSRLELFHMLEQDNTLNLLTQWLYELSQRRHAMWQMGEPTSSEAWRNFLVFAIPVLRIFSSYIRVCNNHVGDTLKVCSVSEMFSQFRIKFLRFELPIYEQGESPYGSMDHNIAHHHLPPGDSVVELRNLSNVMLDAVFLIWCCAGGINGQKLNAECKRIRLAVLDVLTPSLYYEKSLSIVLNHIFMRSCFRPHMHAAALTLFMNLAPWVPPLIIAKSEVPSWKAVVIGHRQRTKRFVNAFFSCDNRHDFAEALLSPSLYVSKLALAFIDRMSRLDRRLALDLAGSVLNYVVTFLKTKLAVRSKESKEKTDTPCGSVTGDDLKENEDHRPASTGMVRLTESFVRLCSVKHFRLVLNEFLSYPSRAGFLAPLLTQFERPTFSSERQLRFQKAVLELLDGFCRPSLWSPEMDYESSDPVGCPLIDATEDPPENFFVDNVNEWGIKKTASTSSTVEIVDTDDTVTALELVDETDAEYKPQSTLEAIISSLWRFVNSSDQKICVVDQALRVLLKATSEATEEKNTTFIEVVRECAKRSGLRPLFEILNKTFDSNEVLACIVTLTHIVDRLFGEQADLLAAVIDFCPAEHPLTSLITKLNDLPERDESMQYVLKTLDKFFHLMNNCTAEDEDSDHSNDTKIPMVYGRNAVIVKVYKTPIVEVVPGTRERYRRIKALSSIMVKREKTVGTRMGTEVSKLIDAYRGKEKAVRRILRTELGFTAPVPQRKRPRKRALAASKETPNAKQKKL